MPELPEVESVRRQLVGQITGRRIVDTWYDAHPHARFHDVDHAVGCTIVDVRRRGKYLIIPLKPAEVPDAVDGVSTNTTTGLDLLLHLGMSGALRITGSPSPTGDIIALHSSQDIDPHDRAWLALDDGRVLRFRDPRRFGRLSVVAAGKYLPVAPTLAALGPEPLTDEFDLDRFAQMLAASRAPIKALLLGQRVVAGVGNIYADEALWMARIHPASRRVGHIRAARLHQALRTVLAAAIAREGTTFRDYQLVNGQSGRFVTQLVVYGKAGQQCSRCGATLRSMVIAQRTSTYCPGCQHP